MLGTDGELAPKAVTYMETACGVETPVTMHPFAYRAHTHIHGKHKAYHKIKVLVSCFFYVKSCKGKCKGKKFLYSAHENLYKRFT